MKHQTTQTPDSFRFRHQRALTKLREYCDDDSIDFERLNPFLSAVDGGFMPAIVELAPSLETYRACSVFIDDLFCELTTL